MLLSVGLLAGCSSVPNFDPPNTPPPTTVPVPADGMSLRELGVKYGPVDAVVIPRQHELRLLTSQINVVNLVFTAPDAQALAEWFRTTLPGAGWEITTDNNGALLFTGYGWDGSFAPMLDGSPGASFSLRKQGQ